MLIGNKRHEKYIDSSISSKSEVGLDIKQSDIDLIRGLSHEISKSTGMEIFINPGIDDLVSHDDLIELYNKKYSEINIHIVKLSKTSVISEALRKFIDKAKVFYEERKINSIYFEANEFLKNNSHSHTPEVINIVSSIGDASINCDDLNKKVENEHITVTLNLKKLSEIIETKKRELLNYKCETVEEVQKYLESSEFLVKCLNFAVFFESHFKFKCLNNELRYKGNKISLDQVLNPIVA